MSVSEPAPASQREPLSFPTCLRERLGQATPPGRCERGCVSLRGWAGQRKSVPRRANSRGSGHNRPADMATSVHPSSILEPGAEIADGVVIGPFCTLGPKVRLDEGVRLVSHVTVAGNTRIGPRTIVY